MTDIEKMKALLTDFGVEFECATDSKQQTFITCYEGAKKVRGYGSFYTSFISNEDGTFNYIGAWE